MIIVYILEDIIRFWTDNYLFWNSEGPTCK